MEEYNAQVPKTILELQEFRQTDSIPIRSQEGREGVATLVNLNPAINVWYLLKVAWKNGVQEQTYHLENPQPLARRFLLDETYPSGIVILEGGKRFRCDLFGGDPDAHVLGQVVFAQGNCKPGMGVKAFPGWTSIYVAAPDLPASVLRGLARFAGVHLYNQEGDVLYATRELLAVHTVSGGARTFSLPREVEEVYDLYERKTLARNAKEFRVTLQPASSALFYTGGAALLRAL